VSSHRAIPLCIRDIADIQAYNDIVAQYNQRIPWSSVLLNKVIAAKLLEKYSACNGTRMSIGINLE
jgi:hypothetical protein